MKTLLYTLLMSLFIHPFILNAQESFSGTLKGWSNGKADIVSIKGEPVPIGEIDKKGEFTISLNHKIIDEFNSTMEVTNSNSSSGSVRFMTIERAFSCYYDSLSVNNGDQKIITLETFGGYPLVDLKNEKSYGSFIAANSKEFADAYRSFGQKNAVKGFYLSWFYLEKEARVKGDCPTKTYALNQEEFYQRIISYQLDFKKGWNLVKISADETFTDRDDKTYVSKWTYKTISSIPENLQYIYFPE